MSTLLDESTPRAATDAADRLRATMAAVRVSLSWFGTRKTLTPEQKQEAAEPFGTDARFLSAGKRLLDIAHPAFKAVTAVRGRVIAYWKSMSLPYPEPGIRLICQQRIDGFAGTTPTSRPPPESAWEASTTSPTIRSRCAGRSQSSSISPAWSRRPTSGSSIRSSTRTSAAECSRASTRPFD